MSKQKIKYFFLIFILQHVAYCRVIIQAKLKNNKIILSKFKNKNL